MTKRKRSPTAGADSQHRYDVDSVLVAPEAKPRLLQYTSLGSDPAPPAAQASLEATQARQASLDAAQAHRASLNVAPAYAGVNHLPVLQQEHPEPSARKTLRFSKDQWDPWVAQGKPKCELGFKHPPGFCEQEGCKARKERKQQHASASQKRPTVGTASQPTHKKHMRKVACPSSSSTLASGSQGALAPAGTAPAPETGSWSEKTFQSNLKYILSRDLSSQALDLLRGVASAPLPDFAQDKEHTDVPEDPTSEW